MKNIGILVLFFVFAFAFTASAQKAKKFRFTMETDNGRPLQFTSHFSQTIKFFPKGGDGFSYDPTKELWYEEHSLGIVARGQGPGGDRHYYFAIKTSEFYAKTLTIVFIRPGKDNETHVIKMEGKTGYLEFSFYASVDGGGDFTKIQEGSIVFNWK